MAYNTTQRRLMRQVADLKRRDNKLQTQLHKIMREHQEIQWKITVLKQRVYASKKISEQEYEEEE
jgi:prefoldin subunit 5